MKALLKQILQVLILVNVFTSFIFAFGTKVNFQVNNGNDDTWFSSVGSQFQSSPYIPLIQTETDVIGAIAFRNLSIPASSQINTAILSLRTVKAYNWTFGNPDMYVSIYGIRLNDLPDWTAPNTVYDLPLTSQLVNWNVANASADQWVNITVTKIVQEITSLYGWNLGNDLGFKILSVSSYIPRYFKANESIPTHSARLYITYGENTAPSSDDTYQESYRNITIWNRTTTGSGGNLTLFKTDDFTSAYADIWINGIPSQRKIIYSNVTESFYVFYSTINHPLYTGAVLYARFNRNGILQSQDNVFYGTLASQFYDAQDFDVGISRDGELIYSILCVDTTAGLNEIQNWDKETLRYVVHSVNTTTLELDQEYTELLSQRAVAPWNLYNKFEYVQMEVLPNGWQIVTSGYKDGASYGSFSVLNNLSLSWNDAYGLTVESLAVDLGDNPANVLFHVTTWSFFNESGVLAMIRSRDAGLDWEYGGYTCNDFINEVIDQGDYVYNSYNITRWLKQGFDSGANQRGLPRDITTISESQDGNIMNMYFENVGRFETWIYNDTDNDYNKEADVIVQLGDYSLVFAYHFEDGNSSLIYTDGDKHWFARNYNFNITDFDNNYTLIEMNSAITQTKGNEDYGSSLKMYGLDGQNDFDPVRGALGVIDDTFSGGGNYSFYLLSVTQPDFRIIVVDENGTVIDNGCMDQAYWNYQVHGNYTLYLEQVKACIDVYLGGSDPQNPNPPDSNYPEGIFSRFGVRWLFLLIGFLCIFIPLCAMAWRTFPLEYYGIFVVVMLIGLGLLWSIAST